MQLSPFSAQISLKKSLVCDKSGAPLYPNSSYQTSDEKILLETNRQLLTELSSLKSKYDNLAIQYGSACDTIKYLKKANEDENKNRVTYDALRNDVVQLKKSLEARDSEVSDLMNKNS